MIEDLLRILNGDGVTAVHDGEAHTITVTHPHWTAPVVIREATERNLRRAASVGEEDRDALWPDASLEEAGFNLLLVHLEELVLTGRADGRDLTLRRGRLEAVLSQRERLAAWRKRRRRRPPTGAFAWEAEGPDGERIRYPSDDDGS